MTIKVCTIVYIGDRVLPHMPLQYGSKIVLNNVVGCEILNQVRPYTGPRQLKAKKPNWHLLLNRDQSIWLQPRYLPCIPLSWIFCIWKNPFDIECLTFVLAHRKASWTRIKRLLMISSCCGLNFSTFNTCLILAMVAATKWHLKGVKWLVWFFWIPS